MRALTLVGFLATVVSGAACGGSGGSTGSTGGKGSGGTTGGTTTGAGCATALCGGACCATGDSCIANACCPSAQVCDTACCDSSSQCVVDEAGNPSCASSCRNSSECNAVTPCCEALDNGQGSFSGSGVCAISGGDYQCLCFASSDCTFLENEQCVPAVDMAGDITGPYVCAANDGNSHDGCNNKVACSTTNEFCAKDQLDNEYCAIACIADEDYTCSSTSSGVACCNTTCMNTEGNLCCGLCRDGG